MKSGGSTAWRTGAGGTGRKVCGKGAGIDILQCLQRGRAIENHPLLGRDIGLRPKDDIGTDIALGVVDKEGLARELLRHDAIGLPQFKGMGGKRNDANQPD